MKPDRSSKKPSTRGIFQTLNSLLWWGQYGVTFEGHVSDKIGTEYRVVNLKEATKSYETATVGQQSALQQYKDAGANATKEQKAEYAKYKSQVAQLEGIKHWSNQYDKIAQSQKQLNSLLNTLIEMQNTLETEYATFPSKNGGSPAEDITVAINAIEKIQEDFKALKFNNPEDKAHVKLSAEAERELATSQLVVEQKQEALEHAKEIEGMRLKMTAIEKQNEVVNKAYEEHQTAFANKQIIDSSIVTIIALQNLKAQISNQPKDPKTGDFKAAAQQIKKLIQDQKTALFERKELKGKRQVAVDRRAAIEVCFKAITDKLQIKIDAPSGREKKPDTTNQIIDEQIASIKQQVQNITGYEIQDGALTIQAKKTLWHQQLNSASGTLQLAQKKLQQLKTQDAPQEELSNEALNTAQAELNTAQEHYDTKKEELEIAARGRKPESSQNPEKILKYMQEKLEGRANEILQALKARKSYYELKKQGKETGGRKGTSALAAFNVLFKTISAYQIAVQTEQTLNINLIYHTSRKKQNIGSEADKQDARNYNIALKNVLMQGMRDTLMVERDGNWVKRIQLPKTVKLWDVKYLAGSIMSELMHICGRLSDAQYNNAAVKRNFVGPLANFMANLCMNKNINHTAANLHRGFKIFINTSERVKRLNFQGWVDFFTVAPLYNIATSRGVIALALVAGLSYAIAPAATLSVGGAAMQWAGSFIAAKYACFIQPAIIMSYNTTILPFLQLGIEYAVPIGYYLYSNSLLAVAAATSGYIGITNFIASSLLAKAQFETVLYTFAVIAPLAASALLSLVYLASYVDAEDATKGRIYWEKWLKPLFTFVGSMIYNLLIGLPFGLSFAILFGNLIDNKANKDNKSIIWGERECNGLISLIASMPGFVIGFIDGVGQCVGSVYTGFGDLFSAIAGGLQSLGSYTCTILAGAYHTVAHPLDLPEFKKYSRYASTDALTGREEQITISNFWEPPPKVGVTERTKRVHIKPIKIKDYIEITKPAGILYKIYHDKFVVSCAQLIQDSYVGAANLSTAAYTLMSGLAAQQTNSPPSAGGPLSTV